MRGEASDIVKKIDDILDFIQRDPNLSCTDELEEELEDLRYELALMYNIK